MTSLTLNLYLLGTPHLERDNQPIQVRRRKGMALLAYLAITGRPHSREALATLLWPEFDQTRALNNLRRELSRLKQDTASDLFLANRKQLSLAPELKLWVDVAQFNALLSLMEEHNHFPDQPCEACLEAITEAISLYNDEFMAGFTLPDTPDFDEWHFFERENLRQSLSGALQKLIKWHRDQEEYDQAITCARRWVTLDPLHEPAQRSLMALYAQDDQQAAALRQYEACVRLLNEELGVEPEPATNNLYEAIRTRQFPPAFTQPEIKGEKALAQGKVLEAQSWFQESLQRARTTDDKKGMAQARHGLGRASLSLEHVEMAQHHFLEALRLSQAANDKALGLLILADMAVYYKTIGEPARAVELGIFVSEHPLCRQTVKAKIEDLLAEVNNLTTDQLATAKEQAGKREIWTTVAALIEDITNTIDESGEGRSASRLPASPTPFIGRKQELADLQQLLLASANNRLLTLIGPGGIGKSRLALEAAIQSRQAFADGVFFVPLAPISSADQIVSAIAEGIDFQFFGPIIPKQQLLDFLRDKEMLLVLDNFEHLIEGATAVAEIMQAAPDICLLITSREALNISGEVIYPLQSFSVPAEERLTMVEVSGYPAVELLLQQARRVRPEFEPDNDDLGQAVRIVRLVQGMPLALVMAAGWLEILSLAEIGDEIANNLSFLESMDRDVPERQRSMRATFDYSWRRLPESGQQAFMKLSVFRGGFNRAAAQTVAGAGLRTLRLLVNRSFISVDDHGRFHIHELLRQYGLEQLEAAGEREQIQTAHSQYFLSALHQREVDIKGKRQLEALAEIEADLGNVRAAWQWAVATNDCANLNQGLETFEIFANMRTHYNELEELFDGAVSKLRGTKDPECHRAWWRLVTRLGFARSYIGIATAETEAKLRQSLTLAQDEEDRFEEALSWFYLGCYELLMEQNTGTAIHLVERCLKQFRQLDEQYYVALALVWLGFARGQNGEPEQFHKICQQCLETALETGNHVVASSARQNLGFLTITTGDYTAAERYCHQAFKESADTGRRQTIAMAQLNLGLLSFLRGEVEQAKDWARKGLQIGERINVDYTKSYAYSILSLCASISEDSVLGIEMGKKSRLLTAPLYYRIISNWACAINTSAGGDDAASWEFLQAALQQGQDAKFPAMITWLMPVAAILQARTQQLEWAAELLGLAFHHPLSADGWLKHWSPIKALRTDLQKELGRDCFQQASARGKELDLETAVNALQAETIG